jgi:hypothetical protein
LLLLITLCMSRNFYYVTREDDEYCFHNEKKRRRRESKRSKGILLHNTFVPQDTRVFLFFLCVAKKTTASFPKALLL